MRIRAASLTPASVNEADRTVDAVVATGAGVTRQSARGTYIEKLDVSGVDPKTLVGAHVLNAHRQDDVDAVLGVVVEAWREGAKLCARLHIADDKQWRRIKAGTLRFLSIGYEVKRVRESRDPQTNARIVTAIEWLVREVSFVPVAADPAAQVRGRPKMKRRRKPTAAVMDIDEAGHVVERDAAGRIIARSEAPVTLMREEPEEEEEQPPAEAEAEEEDEETPRSATDTAIRRLGETLQMERDWIDSQIRSGASEADARAAALAVLRKRSPTVRASQRTPSNDDPAVRAERIGEALFARMHPTHQLSEPARQFAHLSTVDLARVSMRQAGMSTTGLSADALITRALSTSDFPLALGNFTNRELRSGYDATPSAIRTVARQTTAKDFRTKQKIQVETAARLEKVNELGEFKHGNMVEAAESYRIDTYGKIISISRQTLVNDDLGWTADIARGLGREAANFESQFLVDLLESGSGFGPTMADTEPLFDAAHGNLGEAVALHELGGLEEGRLAMRSQRSLNGDIIGLSPKYLIVPPALETAAELVLATIAPARMEDVNPFAGKLSLLIEPRLTGAGYQYYIVADPAQCEGLEYAYLAGAPGPQTETKVGFEIDGIAVKIRLDFGAGFVDWRGWHLNPGVAVDEGGG